jgi:large subunit ribosomal protein L17
MHRHSYQGKKLSRETGQRRALLRSAVTSLVLHETINTTEAKAKEIAPQFERLVTKAKKGDLASQRSLQAFLLTDAAVRKMMVELAPAFKDRNGGYTRVVKTGSRRGDNAPLAAVSLVLPERQTKEEKPKAEVSQEAKTKDETAKEETAKKAPTKKEKAA